MEEVSCHEREQHQTRRQLQIPSPEQQILLSICDADMEEMSGHEREQHETRRQLRILGSTTNVTALAGPSHRTILISMACRNKLEELVVILGDHVGIPAPTPSDEMPG